jgi:hypothetical protein
VAFFVGLTTMSVVEILRSSNWLLQKCSQNAHRFPRMPRTNASAPFFRCGAHGIYASVVIDIVGSELRLR